MVVQKNIKFHPDAINYLKGLSFYNKYIDKTKINRLKNIDLLSELLFYEELSVAKTNKAFEDMQSIN